MPSPEKSQLPSKFEAIRKHPIQETTNFLHSFVTHPVTHGASLAGIVAGGLTMLAMPTAAVWGGSFLAANVGTALSFAFATQDIYEDRKRDGQRSKDKEVRLPNSWGKDVRNSFTKAFLWASIAPPFIWAGINLATFAIAKSMHPIFAAVSGAASLAAGALIGANKSSREDAQIEGLLSRAPSKGGNPEQARLFKTHYKRRLVLKALGIGLGDIFAGGLMYSGAASLLYHLFGFNIGYSKERINDVNKINSENVPDLERNIVTEHIFKNPKNALAAALTGKVKTEDGKEHTATLDAIFGGFSGTRPVEFQDKEGNKVATYYKRNFIAQKVGYDSKISRIIRVIEGGPEEMGRFNYSGRLSLRNLLRDLPSGGSTFANQLIGFLTGKPGERSAINPHNTNAFHDPSKYSYQYAGQLLADIDAGLIPYHLSPVFEGKPLDGESKIQNLTDPSSDESLCANRERALAAQRLLAVYGPEAVMEAYVNNVPIQNDIGLGAVAYRLFRQLDLEKLSIAQSLVLARMIQNPYGYISNLKSTFEQTTQYSSSDLIVNSKAQLDNLLRTGIIKSSQELQQISQELDSMKFDFSYPDDLANQFMDDDYLRGENRKIVEEYIGEQDQSLEILNGTELKPDVQITPDKVIVSNLDIAPKNHQAVVNERPEHFFNEQVETRSLISDYIAQHIEQTENQFGKYYVLTLPNGERINLPSYYEIESSKDIPGLGISLSEYDPSTGEFRYEEEGVTGLPFMPASTIKPLFAAFILAEGLEGSNSGVTSLNDSRFIDKPGKYGLIPGQDFTVKNFNNIYTEKSITLAQMISWSKNSIQQYVQEYLEKNSDGWQKIQDKYMSQLGLEFCDLAGNKLDSPTALAGIGSDIFIKSTDRKISPLMAYSRAFSAFASPESMGIDPNSSFGKALQEVYNKALTNQELREQFWGGKALEDLSPTDGDLNGKFGFKTGTAAQSESGGDIVRDTLTASVYVGPEGTIRTAVGHISGTKKDTNGNSWPTDLTQIGGEESSTHVLPTTRQLLKYWIQNNDGKDYKQSNINNSLQDIENLFRGSETDISYQISEVDYDTEIKDENGVIIKRVPAGSMVEYISEKSDTGSEGGISKVFFLDDRGIPNFGYIKNQVLKNFDISGKQIRPLFVLETLERNSTTSEQRELWREIIEQDPDQVIKKRLILVSKDSNSPLLRSLAYILESNSDPRSHNKTAGAEMIGDILAKLSIDPKTLGDITIVDQAYFNKLTSQIDEKRKTGSLRRLQIPDTLEGDSLTIFNTIKLQLNINAFYEKVSSKSIEFYNSLIRDGQTTPSGLIILSLLDNSRNQFIKDSLLPEGPFSRVYRIFFLSDKINKTDNPNENDINELLKLTNELNSGPTDLELKALGLK